MSLCCPTTPSLTTTHFNGLRLNPLLVPVSPHAGVVLFDELVLPHNPITDHNTRFSGIDAQTLSKVKTRLEDVQVRMCARALSRSAIVSRCRFSGIDAQTLLQSENKVGGYAGEEVCAVGP
mgnify:CR=1 FL=1